MKSKFQFVYNLNNTINLHKSGWMPISLGAPDATSMAILPFYFFSQFLTNMGFPVYVIQAIVFYIIMTTSSISVYFLSSMLFNKFKNLYLISFFSAIFYLLNPFTMISIWQRFVYAFYFQMAILPSIKPAVPPIDSTAKTPAAKTAKGSG